MKNDISKAIGITAPVILLLWAGLSLGGNLIAAPAKFQVASLPLEDLLRIGRAQFAWLGIAEIVFAFGFIGLCIFNKAYVSWASAAALLLLTGQQTILQPMLQARTDLILAAQSAPDSHLHLVFIATELAKFILLIWSATRLLKSAS